VNKFYKLTQWAEYFASFQRVYMHRRKHILSKSMRFNRLKRGSSEKEEKFEAWFLDRVAVEALCCNPFASVLTR